MPDTPLNPDALNELGVERAQDAYGDAILNRWWPRKTVIRIIRAYLAVAQPVVNSVEELATTHVGRALANAAFNEGMSAGIRACNDSLDGEPFVKPASPYRPEVKP